ncbi:hypothetical protein L1049_026869 [Liquidambar formosana]|uniref:SHSP domain-containing protein n=1 Tax=Liquidambar formosana TaxID=63359 RepID=A0AAP0NHU7_LIQFO
MELELSLKLTNVRDGLPFVDLRIAKDRAGPLFLSRETETMFILTAHLKGIPREIIKIEINDDGTQIVISGEKPVQEMLMVGSRMYKNEVEIWGFKKIFRIPDGVVLDRIKAKYNEEEAILRIVMPKSIRGFRGVGIEEVKDEEVDRGGSEKMPIVEDTIPKQDTIGMTSEQESKEPEIKGIEEVDQVVEKSPETPEIECAKEREETTPEEVETAPTTVTSPETANMEQEEVELQGEPGQPEEAEVSPPEKTGAEEIPKLEEEVQQEGTPAAESEKPEEGSEKHDSSPETIEPTKFVENQAIQQAELPNETSTELSQVEEEHSTKGEIAPVENEMPQEESQKHETKTDIEEPVEHQPDNELEQTENLHPEHPADQEKGNEEHVQEESHGVGNEIQQEATDQLNVSEEKEVDGQESSEVEKQKGPSDQTTQLEKSPSKKSKRFGLVAGSAFLVSLIVLVIQLIRAKKK